MFEDALLDSSLRNNSVLHRTHFLLCALAAAVVFAAGTHLLPMLLVPAAEGSLMTTAALAAATAGLYAAMICYVWEDTRQRQWQGWPWVVITAALNLPGFLFYLIYAAHKTGDWKRAAIPLAYVAETLFVGMLVLVPLIYTQAIPSQLLTSGVAVPLVPAGRTPRPAGPRVRSTPHHWTVDPFSAPTVIPTNIPTIIDPPKPPEMPASPEGPVIIGLLDGPMVGDRIIGAPPWGSGPSQPPPPPRPATKPQIVRVSGDVIAAKAVFHPKPDYPRIAISAHIQGTVVLQAIIGKDGTIQNLKVLSGPALLAQAAVATVQTWRYQPTLLGSEPVEVLTEIDVIFNLGD